MRNKWTLEKLQEEADKYSTRSEFQKNNIKAYNSSRKRNLLNILFKKHENNGYCGKHSKGYWTLERLQENADKYKTRGEFQKNCNDAYCAGLKNNLMNILFKYHDNNGYYNKPNGYWTLEKLQNEANKYITRTEFKKNCGGAYYYALKSNLMDILFKNHKNNGYLNDDGWIRNNYVIYVYELIDFNIAYVGLTNNIKRRDKEHLFNTNEKLGSFCKSKNISYPEYKIIEIGLNSYTVRNREEFWLKYYIDNKWEIINVAKTGSLGGIEKYSKTKLQIEANNYKNRLDFSIKNPKMYSSAKNRKMLDELFKNHYNNGFLENKWTFEILQIEANKHETINSFIKNNYNAYRAALKLKIIKVLFKNHKNNGYKKKI